MPYAFTCSQLWKESKGSLLSFFFSIIFIHAWLRTLYIFCYVAVSHSACCIFFGMFARPTVLDAFYLHVDNLAFSPFTFISIPVVV